MVISAALPAGANAIGTVAVSNLPATQPVSATALPLPTGAAIEAGNLATIAANTGRLPAQGQALAAASVPVVLTAAQVTTLTPLASVGITGGLPAGTNTIGSVGLVTQTSGGATAFSYLAAASANQDSTVIKASAGQVYGWQLFNTSAASRYVKVYDKVTAPTSADTPIKRYFLPAGGGVVIPAPSGVVFTNGLAFRITAGVADTDATAVTANDVIVNCNFK